jgi:tRNA (guanine-N7-)-methyltransferase
MNSNPVVLELACGGGEYTVALAEMYPDLNFVGVDRKGARIWKGAKRAIQLSLKNVAFVRTKIDLLDQVFSPADLIEKIWITFPDPQPRSSQSKKRLTAPGFLQLYRSFASAHCEVNLKTDSRSLFLYTIEICEQQGLVIMAKQEDIYESGPLDPELHIRTFYEHIWLRAGLPINYLKFRLNRHE